MIAAMPVFIVKNFFRDTLAGFVAGRYPQVPFARPQGVAAGRTWSRLVYILTRPAWVAEAGTRVNQFMPGRLVAHCMDVQRIHQSTGTGLSSRDRLRQGVLGDAPPGARIAAQCPRGTGVADHAAEEIPVVLQVRLRAGEPGTLSVAAAEHLPTGMPGLDQLGSIVERDGQAGRVEPARRGQRRYPASRASRVSVSSISM